MIDTIRFKLLKFKIRNRDTFYRKKGTGVLPYIDTLKNTSCYFSLPTNGEYQEFHLKSHIKYQPLGYIPSRIVIKDIPFNRIRFWLEIEIALPKVFLGHNFYVLTENQFEEVINAIFDMLLQFGVEVDTEELRTLSNISRIDFSKNIQIQTPVKDFVLLLHKFQKKRSRTFDNYENSVAFGNKQQCLVVYDKVDEVTKVLRNKHYNNRTSKEYQAAKILDVYKKVHGLNVIRVEHRLLNKQAIKRELTPILGFYPFTFKDLFSTDVAAQILAKHWQLTFTEEQLKQLLLGEKHLSFVFDEVVKATKQSENKFNSLSVLYIKLLHDTGMSTTTKRFLKTISSSSLDKHKKKLNEITKQIFFTTAVLRTIKKLQKRLLTGMNLLYR